MPRTYLALSAIHNLMIHSHVRRLSAEVNSPMPVIDIAHQHLLTARAIHQSQKQECKAKFDTLDWSGMVAGVRVAAGLDGLDSQQVSGSSHDQIQCKVDHRLSRSM